MRIHYPHFRLWLTAATLVGGLMSDAAAQEERVAEQLDPQAREATFSDQQLSHGLAIAKGGAQVGGVGMKCMACHGLKGEGGDLVPRLAGLPYAYLVRQIRSYLTGDRASSIMGPISANLTPDEVHAVLAYYADLETPDLEPPTDLAWQLVDAGEVLVYAGRRSADGGGLTACIMCHNAVGDLDDVVIAPPLAGQPSDYITAQLTAWRDGARGGDPLNVMAGIAEAMTDEEIEAVSAFYASRNPAETE